MTAPRVVVVAKKSAYARFIEEEQDPRAKELLRRRDDVVRHWPDSHREHLKTLDRVEATLVRLGAHTVRIDRPHAEFDTSDASLVVVVGGDGTLLAASHSIRAVPLLGVNSDPRHSVGFFCAAHQENVESMLQRALGGTLRTTWLTRMQVSVNGRVRSRRVLNEALFSHSVPAATSRYILHVGRASEKQHSSGVWVGPAAGSTAAQHSAGGMILPLQSKRLQVVVREPYLRDGRMYRILRRKVAEGTGVSVKSQMQNANLYLDGPYRRISISLGEVARFCASKEPLCVLGLEHRSLRRPPRRRTGQR
jgi:NAD+ kinase